MGNSKHIEWLTIVGFAAHLVFVSYIAWPSALSSIIPPEYVDTFSPAKSLSFTLTFFIFLIASPAITKKINASNKLLMLLMMLSALFGVAALFLSSIEVVANPVPPAIAGILIGVSTALGYVLWQCAFLRPQRMAILEVAAGSAIAGAAYFVISWFSGQAILVVSIIVFFISCLSLWRILFRESKKYTGQHLLAASPKALLVCIKRNSVVLIITAAMGFVWGLFHVIAVEQGNSSYTINFYAFGRLIAAGAFLLCLTRLDKPLSLSSLYRYILPLYITATLLYPILGERFSMVLSMLYYTAFGLCSIALIVACPILAQDYKTSPSSVYCCFFGVIYLAYEVGSALSGSLLRGGLIPTGLTLELAVALAIIYLFSILGFSLKKRTPDGGKTLSAPCQQHECTSVPSEGGNVGAAVEMVQTSLAEMGAKSTDSQAVRYEDALGCYGLTPRELEIAKLLMRGRDVAYICEHLSLSKNTIRSHVKSIYQKTGVHSRQELIDLGETL